MGVVGEDKTSNLGFLTITTPVHRPRPPAQLMSSDGQIADQSNQTPSLKTNISALASLITSAATTAATANGDRPGDLEAVDRDDVGELGAEDVEELIRQLEAANSITDGAEYKLDGTLEHLDGLSNSLEAAG